MANIPVALVSGAVTAGVVKTDYLDGEEWQVIKLNIGAASADNLFVGGQRDSENSLSIVGASGALFNVAASVRGNVAASVAGTVVVAVSAGQVAVTNQVDVSAHGLVSAGGHVLVSVDGTIPVVSNIVSAGVTAQGGGSLMMGATNASVATFFLVDANGRQVVAVSGGQIAITGAIFASAQVSVLGNVATSVAGNVAASVAGHVLVSGDGTFAVKEVNIASAGVTAAGAGYLVMGVDSASAARFLLTDTVGRHVVAVSGGQVAITGAIFASAQVSVLGNVATSVAGNVAVSAAGHVLVSGDGTFQAIGNVASHAADAGAPVKMGGIAVVSVNPASAAASSRANFITDKIGRQVVVNQHTRELTVQAVATVESAVQKTIFASGGAGIFNDLTSLDITNSAATAATIFIADASGAPVLIYNLAAGGGFIKQYQPPWKQTTADRVWSVTISPSVSSFIFINAQAVQNT